MVSWFLGFLVSGFLSSLVSWFLGFDFCLVSKCLGFLVSEFQRFQCFNDPILPQLHFMLSGGYWSHIQDFQELIRRSVGIVWPHLFQKKELFEFKACYTYMFCVISAHWFSDIHICGDIFHGFRIFETLNLWRKETNEPRNQGAEKSTKKRATKSKKPRNQETNKLIPLPLNIPTRSAMFALLLVT